MTTKTEGSAERGRVFGGRGLQTFPNRGDRVVQT